VKKILSLLFVALILSVTIADYCFSQNSIAENKISWTQGEITFMEEHPLIQLGVDPKFVPFEFFDEDGEYTGITADYLSLISERTGL